MRGSLGRRPPRFGEVRDGALTGHDGVRPEQVTAGAAHDGVRLGELDDGQVYVALPPAMLLAGQAEAFTRPCPVPRAITRLALQPPPVRDGLDGINSELETFNTHSPYRARPSEPGPYRPTARWDALFAAGDEDVAVAVDFTIELDGLAGVRAA